MESCRLTAMALQDLTSLLMKCRKEKNFAQALSLQDQIQQIDLDTHSSLGNLMISMWVEIGSMCHARKVFDKLKHKETHSWNSLIKGYAHCGESEHALTMYQKMQRDGSVQPDSHTLVALVKACAFLRDLDRGHKIYLDVSAKGFLENNIFMSSTFVDMYAKCGSLSRAQDLFDKLRSRDIVLWTALIRGYAEHGPAEKALKCLEQMQDEGISPDAATLVCISKACGSIGAMGMGLETHGVIAKAGLFENNCVLGSSLVAMYAKFGMLAEAQKVFDMLSVQDVVSWTSLLAGYAEHGQGELAISCLEEMQQEGILPNSTTFVCGLKACRIMASNKGLELHAMIIGTGAEINIYVGSALVDMYVKCASLIKAQEVFDGLTVRNVVSWNALLTGYTEHGLDKEALKCFQEMQDEGISPDSVTLVCSLRACSSTGDINKGRELYVDVVRKGFETDLITGNTMIDMFVKCSSLEEAWDVFSKLPLHNVVSWTALISGYIDHKRTQEAFDCLEVMRQDGIYPSSATFVCNLKACTISREVKKGRELHIEIARFGLEKELLIGNTLIDMYATYGLFLEAFEVLEKLPNRDVVTWNALIAAFVEHGCNQEGLECLEQMQCEAVSPDAVTFICSLKACCNIGAPEKGRELHAEITKQGLSGTEAAIFNTLVGMYAKFGLLLEAKEVLNNLVVKNVVAWNAIIAAYTEQGHGEAALRCLEEMEPQGVSPDVITVVCSLKACGSIGARGRGQGVHSYVCCKGLEVEPLVGNTLVFMYAKCGLLATAQDVFDKLLNRNVVSWTALLAGYAQLGEIENVFNIFEGMIRGGITPDLTTFGSVLSACSYSGLVDKGQMYFEAMHSDHNLIPSSWHHMCIIDLLGRAGQIEEAVAFTREMPCHPPSLAWHVVLGACRKWGLVDLGNLAFEHAFELDEQDAPAYICIGNIYCDAAMLEDANRFEAMPTDRPAWNLLELDLLGDSMIAAH